MTSKNNFQKFLSFLMLLVIPVVVLVNFTLLKSKRNLATHFCTDFISKDDELLEKSFVFVLYANEPHLASLEKTLSSIFHQQYENYRVIFIATEMVQAFIPDLEQVAARENKLHLFKTHTAQEANPTIAIFKEAVECCKDEEIIIHMDSTNWLAHEQVLINLNKIYASSHDVWLTYSQYLEYPSLTKNTSPKYIKRMLRHRFSDKIPWLSAPFKTFYAGLFKQIHPDEKFSYHRPLTQDVLDLYMLPLAELSKNHIRFVEETLTLHKSDQNKL